MLLNFNRLRYAGFGRPPVIVTETGGDIADPGCDDLFNATGADQLVELHIGYRRDQGEIFLSLPYNLVAGGEWNQRFEPAPHGDGTAVMDVLRDSVMEISNLVHIRHLYPLCEWSSTQLNHGSRGCSGFMLTVKPVEYCGNSLDRHSLHRKAEIDPLVGDYLW
jgi:hypothetical protein